MLKRSASTGKALLVDVTLDEKLARSVRNIRGVRAGARAAALTARDVVDAPARSWRPRRRSRSCRRRWGKRCHETHRRHSPAAHHREDRRSCARTAGRSCSRWRADANKIEIKRAVEQLLGVEGRQRPDQHRARQGQAAGPLRRPPLRLEEGVREAARRREDAGIPGRGVRRSHADSQIQPDVAGPAVPDGADLRRDHDGRAVQAADRAAAPSRAAATTAASSRRGGAAAATSGCTASSTSSATSATSRRRCRRSSTTRTARRASRCLTYADGEKRYILQPIGLKVGDTIVAGRERRHPAGQRAAAEEHPARHA